MSTPQENENEMESSINVHSGVIAALSVIGGVDSRARIGGSVTSDSIEGLGTVCRISQSGKLVVQLHDTTSTKKLALGGCNQFLEPQFNLDNMPVTENVLDTWANLFCKSH